MSESGQWHANVSVNFCNLVNKAWEKDFEVSINKSRVWNGDRKKYIILVYFFIFCIDHPEILLILLHRLVEFAFCPSMKESISAVLGDFRNILLHTMTFHHVGISSGISSNAEGQIHKEWTAPARSASAGASVVIYAQVTATGLFCIWLSDCISQICYTHISCWCGKTAIMHPLLNIWALPALSFS